MNALSESLETRCSASLEQALSTIPFYRRWRHLDPGPRTSIAARLAALPTLKKQDLRAFSPDGFITEGRGYREAFASGEVEMVTTSGTSEDRLSVAWNQAWWDRSERAGARLNPVLDRLFTEGHREAVLTSPVCAANRCHVGEVPMAERMLDNLLFLNQSANPTAWGARNIRRMAEELAEFQPELIEADPAYLAILSREALSAGIALHQPACIVLTYEFPSRLHLRWIRRAFPGAAVVSSYGSTETGHVFTQCEAGTFHQNTETCFAQVQPLRADPRVGRLLVGTLDNPWLTLVRFDIGDLARLRPTPCPCGRTDGLSVESIEGRVRDLTFDVDGAPVTLGRVDGELAAVPGLASYQVVQSGPGEYAVRFTAEPGTEEAAAAAIPAVLRGMYGESAAVRVLPEAAIAPEPSGKFRLARASFAWDPEGLFA
jgi:phenylacetate-CoA ligase